MKHGFLKVAVGTPSIKVADCAYNQQAIASLMKKAAEKGAKILVLPELCVTGYTCGDLFLQTPLLDAALGSLNHLLEESKCNDLLTLVGMPLRCCGKLYNCAVLFQQGEILGVVPKTSLPNYSEFYEARHFVPAPAENSTLFLLGKEVPFGSRLLFACRQLQQLIVGVEICEDLWTPNPISTQHALAGATVILNPSASNETVGKEQYRRMLVQSQSARLVCGYLYSDAGEGESTTDLVFAGHNLIAENGAVLSETPLFCNNLAVNELDLQLIATERQRMTTFPPVQREGYDVVSFSLVPEETRLTRKWESNPFVPNDLQNRETRCERILSIQSAGLKKRLEHSRSKTAVVGISGGLDSCLALLVSVRAMDLLKRPRTDVIAITMPCFGTTQRTRSNAELLSQLLGVTLQRVDITRSVLQHFSDIEQDPQCYDVTFENSQARERTQVLMDVANKTGGLVVGTGDLSELALGWATYNGDHMSMYGVNASVPKTLVRYVVRYEADHAENTQLQKVLYDILDTPVSPELLPAAEGEISQKTEDLVGPYELHDFFLYHIFRYGFCPEKVLRLAQRAFEGRYSRDVILYWMKNFYRRFFASQFKRSCIPDGPKVGSVALSPRGDWRMPSDASASVWLSQADAL